METLKELELSSFPPRTQAIIRHMIVCGMPAESKIWEIFVPNPITGGYKLVEVEVHYGGKSEKYNLGLITNGAFGWQIALTEMKTALGLPITWKGFVYPPPTITDPLPVRPVGPELADSPGFYAAVSGTERFQLGDTYTDARGTFVLVPRVWGPFSVGKQWKLLEAALP